MAEAGDGMTPRGTTAATTIQAAAPVRAARRSHPLVPMALLLVLVAIGFLHARRQPLDRDITTYAVIGRELLAGRRLYTDIWDNKPPAIHVVFAAAELVGGAGPWAIFLLNMLAATASLSGVYLAVRAAGMSTRAALWAAALLALLTFNVKFQGNMPNTEVWINACLIWMLVLLFRCRSGPMNWRTAIGLGLLAAAATLFKHVAAFPVALVALVDLGVAGGGWASRAARLARWIGAGAIVVAAWSAVGGYFWLHGRFHDFYDAVIVYNASFIEGQRVTWRAVLSPEFMPLLLPAIVPAAVVLGLAVMPKARWLSGGERRVPLAARLPVPSITVIPEAVVQDGRSDRSRSRLHPSITVIPEAVVQAGAQGTGRQAASGTLEPTPQMLATREVLQVSGRARAFSLHLAMALGCYAAALAPGKFYPHYFQLLFPTIALSLGWVVGLLAESPMVRRAWLADLVAAVLLLPLVVAVAQAMLLSPEEWSRQGYGTDFVETWKEAPRLSAWLKPGETFWDMGSETGLYYLTAQAPPVSVFYQPPLFHGPLAPRFAQHTLEQLQQRPPDLIVLLASRSSDVLRQRSTPLVAWVPVHYFEVFRSDTPSFRHFVRRGSALAERLTGPNPSTQP